MVEHPRGTIARHAKDDETSALRFASSIPGFAIDRIAGVCFHGNMKQSLVFLLFYLLASVSFAASDKAIVAVPEFHNGSGKVVRLSGSDLAAWMSNELKRTDLFRAADRKAVARTVKGADWNGDRLSMAVEARLKELPAQYVLYGAIREWHIVQSVSELQHPDMGDRSTLAAATVVLSLILVDLSSGRSVKEFLVDGNAIANPDDSSYPDPPYQDDDVRFNRLYEEAAKIALRKAARQIDKEE